mgnify:CR=1 FL=1
MASMMNSIPPCNYQFGINHSSILNLERLPRVFESVLFWESQSEHRIIMSPMSSPVLSRCNFSFIGICY